MPRGGGIRKKKSKRKDPNRQRLQKAVTKSAEKERKQQQRYEAFQNRHLRTVASSTDAAPQPILISTESQDGDANSTFSSISTYVTPRDAYNKLMKLLAPVEKPSTPKRPRSGLNEEPINGQQQSVTGDVKKPRCNANDSGNASASEPPPEVSEEVADATAAARALAHFGLDSATVQAKSQSELKATVTVEDVGRAQATYEFPVRSALPTDIRALSLQPTLETMWRKAYGSELDALSAALVCSMRDFRDVVLTRRLPPATECKVRRLAVAHALAHVLRCRAQVKRHNNANGDDAGGDGVRDQGFARARILFLVPMRNAAYEVVRTMAELCAPVTAGAGEAMRSIAHRARFEKEFAPADDDEHLDLAELDSEEHAAEVATAGYDRGAREKPTDFRYTFRGNCDDDFKLGIQLYRKNIKLYTDFYDSDIIVASPLGLQRSQAAKAAGYQPGKKKAEEEEEWKSGLSAEKNRKREVIKEDDGFLSSIEVCVVDSAHVFEMQNWAWCVDTLRRVNVMPENTRDTDFSRVREWALDGLMNRFRQTVLLSAYRSPNIMALARTFQNHAGRVLIGEPPTTTPARKRLTGTVRQLFQRVPKTGDDEKDGRFEYFDRVVLAPLLAAGTGAPALVVVPSYFDFVRLRNALYRAQRDDKSIAFATMCEYSRAKDVARARARMARKQVAIVVCTERFHFYWRHWLRGAHSVVWYAPPANAHFYPEFLNMLLESATMTPLSTMLFDHTDALSLARIVGDARCRKLLRAKEDSHEFIR